MLGQRRTRVKTRNRQVPIYKQRQPAFPFYSSQVYNVNCCCCSHYPLSSCSSRRQLPILNLSSLSRYFLSPPLPPFTLSLTTCTSTFASSTSIPPSFVDTFVTFPSRCCCFTSTERVCVLMSAIFLSLRLCCNSRYFVFWIQVCIELIMCVSGGEILGVGMG